MTHRDRTHRPRRTERPALRRRRPPQPPPPAGDALALAIQHSDWERAALLLVLGVAAVARTLPEGDIVDLLTMLDGEEDRR